MTPQTSDETLTARRRKEQVLSAAADCFRRKGFHGSSMSEISAAAGMRSGHIYHYFASKEDIIAAIVAREHGEIGQLIEDVKATMKDSDAVSAVVDLAPSSAARLMDTGHATLMLEVVAEAARNPKIAALVQQSDAELQASFCELLGGCTPDMLARLEIVSALFEGLSIRALRNPKLGEVLDREMLQRVLRYALAG